MKKAILYIGHNNATKTLETQNICAIVSEHFEGFTTEQVTGYWRGQKEDTLKVEIVTDSSDSKIVALCKELRVKLSQEAIMLEIVESNVAFISE